MNLFQFLADVFLKEAQNLFKLSKLLKKNPKTLLQLLTSDPVAFAEELGNLSPKARKIFSLDITKAQKEAGLSVDTSVLSSSAISSGTWEAIGAFGDTGNLTITFKKSGTSYTYPSVSRRVWEAMKRAKGQNGSGAMSVFWALYLRASKDNPFNQLQAKAFKLAGIKAPSADGIRKSLAPKKIFKL